jgi:hypothetical protein
MPTFAELEQAAISRYKSGDVEGAKRLKEQALAQQQHELVAGQAIAAFKNGDVDSAKELKQQALDILAPYEESTFTDIGRGLRAAPVTVAQGITEFAAAGLDASLGTEYSRPVTEAFEAFKKEHDLDPKTAAGEITEELLGFGLGFIPIAGWLGRASMVAKGGARTAAKSKFFKSAEAFGKSGTGKALLKSRTGLIGSTALSVAGYETIVTPDGRPTMSDAFDVMPLLQTEDTSKMDGFELATTRLKNKAKRGFEGGLASLTFDVGLPVAGAAARSLGTVPGVSEVTSTLARTSSGIFNAVGRQIGKVPGVGVTKKFLTEQLSATGTKYGPMAEEILDVEAVGSQAQRTALKFFSEYEDATNQFFKFVDIEKPRLLRGRGAKDKKQLEKDLYDFLLDPTTSTRLDGYGKVKNKKTVNRVKDAATRMADLDFKFQDAILKELELRKATLDRLPGTKGNVKLNKAIEEIKENQASKKGYLRRRFDQYDNSEQFYKALDLEGPAFNAAYVELRTALENKNLQRPLTKSEKLQVSKKKNEAEIKKQLKESAENNRLALQVIDQNLNDLQLQKANLARVPGSDTTQIDDAIKSLQRQKEVMKKPKPVEESVSFTKEVYSSKELDDMARDKLYSYIGLAGAKSVPEAKKMLTELQKTLKLGRNKIIKEGRAVSLTDDMFTERIEDLDKLPALLALKGEIKDPKKVFLNTISDMSSTLAGLKFYRNAAGDFSTDLKTGLKEVAEGKLPLIIRPVTTVGSREQSVPFARAMGDAGITDKAIVPGDDILKGLGYVRIGVDDTGELTTGVFGGRFGDLTGAYVRPEIKEALTTPARMGLDGMGQAVAIGATLKGAAQRMAIVPNPISQVRNIYGNLMYLAGNANLSRDSDFVDTFRLIAANVSQMDDKGFARLSNELGALGVTDTSLVTSALRDFKDFADKFNVSGGVSNVFEGFNKAIPFMKQFEALYSESDSMFKLMAVFAEQSKMTNALGKAGFNLNDTLSLPSGFRAALAKNLMDSGLAKRAGSLSLDDSPGNLLLTMAGDTVKDTMPVYSRIGKAIRRLDAIPVFGNFTSFASENIRNSYNTLHRGLKELSFKVDDDLKRLIGAEKAGILERQIRGMGSQRLMSYLAVAAATPAAVTKASMLATGTSQEEMDAAESLVAEFYQGHALGTISNDGRGNIQLFDQSFVNPYGFVRDPIINAMRMYEKKGGLNASEAEQIATGAWAGILGYLEPFGSESIIFERARDVLPAAWLGRGGETQTGSKVYQDGESLGSKVSQGVTHMLSAYIPGYGRMFYEERGGEIQEGRLTRGLMGLPGTRGQTYTGNEELARAVTGFTPITLNLRQDFQFKGGEYLPLRSSAKGVATSVIKKADSTIEEMNSAWDTYLNDLYREQSKLYYNVLQARKLNVDDQSLRSQLKSAGLGAAEISAILQGRFWPGLATKELIVDTKREMRSEDRAPRVIQDIPWSSFNEKSNNVRNQPLSPEVGAQERAARLEAKKAKIAADANAAMNNVGAAQNPVPIQPVQQLVQQPSAPQPQTFLGSIGNVASDVAGSIGNVGGNVADLYKTYAPTVLGGDLASQAANEEILRRQQGQ